MGKKKLELYWAMVGGNGRFWTANDDPTNPWLQEVWGTIPPMSPHGYKRVQVKLVIVKHKEQT